MEILNWRINPEIKEHLDNHYQAEKSLEMSKRSPEEIIGMYTFSYGAPQLTMDGAKRFLNFVEKIIGKPLSGVGVEVGAGPGTHTALLANEPAVTKIYGVEASESIVRNLMPVVVPYIAKENARKVIGVVGEFNNIELPNESVDFVFDFFSLHHTPLLETALKEIFRVLKPGGFVFCFDKARADNLTDVDLNQLLDAEYSRDFKIKMGVDPNTKHTRRMNGENEYRRKEWLSFLKNVGFKKVKHLNVARTNSRNLFIQAVKIFISILPPRMQLCITSFFKFKPSSNISSQDRIYSKLVDFYQKEISLLIGYK